jgi:hypothetical protein
MSSGPQPPGRPAEGARRSTRRPNADTLGMPPHATNPPSYLYPHLAQFLLREKGLLPSARISRPPKLNQVADLPQPAKTLCHGKGKPLILVQASKTTWAEASSCQTLNELERTLATNKAQLRRRRMYQALISARLIKIRSQGSSGKSRTQGKERKFLRGC